MKQKKKNNTTRLRLISAFMNKEEKEKREKGIILVAHHRTWNPGYLDTKKLPDTNKKNENNSSPSNNTIGNKDGRVIRVVHKHTHSFNNNMKKR